MMRWTLVAAFVGATSLGAADGLPREFFGLNGLTYFHYREDPEATATVAVKHAVFREAGAGTDRGDFWWGVIEPATGQWEWRYSDFLADFFKEERLDFLPILCYNRRDVDASPADDAEITAFANYVRETVGRYRGRFTHYEVWNEPNIPTFWQPAPDASAYSRLLRAAVAAGREADPAARFLAGSTSMTDIVFLNAVGRTGAIAAADVWSFHPYSLGGNAEEMDLHRQIRNVRTALADHGITTMPLWITEMGWQARLGDEAATHDQVLHLVQSFCMSAAEDIERLIWFCTRDWREGAHIEAWGLAAPDNTRKPSFLAYQTMVRHLLGATFRGYLEGENGIGYVFERDGKAIVAAWAWRFRTASLPQLAGAPAVSALGEDRGPFPGRLTFDDSPIWLTLDAIPAGVAPERTLWHPALVNGGFEDGTTTMPYGWGRGWFAGGENEGTYVVESGAGAAEGKRFVGLRDTTDAVWLSYPVPMLPGEEVVLTGRVKCEDATGVNHAQILFLGNTGWAPRGGPASGDVTGSMDWVRFEVTGHVPENADWVRVRLVSHGNSGGVWFDDLRLERRGRPAQP